MTVEAVPLTDSATRRRIGATVLLSALVALLALVSLGIGPVRLSPLVVAEALFGAGSEVSQVIVREIRLPRTLLAVLIGATVARARGFSLDMREAYHGMRSEHTP